MTTLLRDLRIVGSYGQAQGRKSLSVLSGCEVRVKLLWVGILTLVFNLGCGGYGSGMGTTPAATPQIAPSSGMYSTPLTVTISDSLPGVVIYVTTDGSMPSLSSPVYHGPFSLTQSGQVKVQAIVSAGGYSSSPVAVATYTLQ